MRIALNPVARRLLRRVPHQTAYSALELLLLALIALQCARLVWTALAPVGPVGAWQAEGAVKAAPAAAGATTGFDPFFRLAEAGPVAVTALDLTLHGVSENRASGGGSAIIATADGAQRSFAIGDEIAPGATLTAVGFDHVTVSRGGTPERLFLDQSSSAPVVVGAPASAPAAPVTAPAAAKDGAPQ
ncbi:type II secretion system protein N [Sphingosinicella sp. LY1275]|uniref:type II secretion system protein N n=1 Tax=Sphingosinicella sp. LY1275 TaxID=3095379 RepID=UPI002ADEDD92|nr:type II secretion system protein N [Sphingosinicella sp. LY1275]MEA1014612.1 type II secretion system protein N [Sphingosinicella sp. LY1275]